jgi:hypothetical protein
MKRTRPDTQLLIGSVIFPRVDQIDFTGPFEVFSRIPNVTCVTPAKEPGPLYFGATPVDERVVVDGNLVSAAGVTAGIDGALRVAELLSGTQKAQEIQLEIQYAPDPPLTADRSPPRRRK